MMQGGFRRVWGGHPERRQSVILVCLLLWSVVSFLLVSHFLFRAAEVEGDSMQPTLESGERMLIDRVAYRWHLPCPGDVVAIQLPGEDLVVKRVIGCPGDVVRLPAGRVSVNGRVLQEPYLSRDTRTEPGRLTTQPYAVQPECYFVLGDNRGVSVDSRFFGAVRREWIVGRVTSLRQAVRDLSCAVTGL